MRAVAGVLAAVVLFSLTSEGQNKKFNGQVPQGNTVCTFQDGKQLSIRYPEVPYGKAEPPHGRVWEPANRPLYLFSQTDLDFGSQAVPPGAYSVYPIPGKDSWTLVLNKEVEKGKSYDPSQNLATLTAQTGKLSSRAGRLKLYFGRISPKKCTLRIDYGKQRAFADFAQK